MVQISRRGFFIATGGAALGLTAACGNGVGTANAQRIDARVDATRDFLFSRYPGTVDLAAKAQGVLYIPLMTEAGFGFGGAYGQGALRINDVTVDYYSATKVSAGLQIGAQQYAHALFFMTEQSLGQFRAGEGWAAGADLKYAVFDQGGNLGLDTTTALAPVIALVFGQAGLLVGATLAGTKYTRIIP
ncbi:twin-arginine translocation pathway signal [Haematobacter missouriensis]|uniref:Twin-arginine translocation pathway signal n=2 Tax=Haematobacter TaxID=366614 RepID=A0A212ASQ7_9RHOB|nr:MULTISPECIES: YSC84-related protein [Haematobacter]KFI32274.1 twin-arginine translocation pathway signal [Haematobacter missouriensis]OWJ75282.1 twin-arginine translocation pathway signal [Haematobacter missouriensis]OWJ79901.1 twin-arginine translocation pathway signal [Haematobacter genomosp. 1]OWJ84484.1 twin-arginine translocation pathway signal [Haematobacter missouriensis]